MVEEAYVNTAKKHITDLVPQPALRVVWGATEKKKTLDKCARSGKISYLMWGEATAMGLANST